MANHLIKRGGTYHVKVAIPDDVYEVFGKRVFQQTLKTSDRAVAIARSGPLILAFKQQIEEARGNPTKQLDEYLEETRLYLKDQRNDPDFDPDSVASLQDEVIDKLAKSFGAKHPDELTEAQEAQAIRLYKITDGQLTPFEQPLEDYIASRKVETKTEEKDRHAVLKFALSCPMVEDVNRQAVRDFVKKLSQDEGLKNRTIKDNLSTLRVYWRYLVEAGIATEDRANPFENVALPAVNRKDAAEKVRLPFTVSDIKKLHAEIASGRSEMMLATFELAIYTGCRLEELASLETENVTEDTIEIVRAKTVAGNRTIPIHDALRPLVADLRGRGNKYLLTDLSENKYGKRGGSMSKQFGKVKTRLGYDERYVFHSIRKTVTTMFEQAGVPENVSADILGHDKQTMSYGLYSGGSSMAQKRDGVMKLDYRLTI